MSQHVYRKEEGDPAYHEVTLDADGIGHESAKAAASEVLDDCEHGDLIIVVQEVGSSQPVVFVYGVEAGGKRLVNEDEVKHG